MRNIKEEQDLAFSIFFVESLDDLIDQPLVRKFLDVYLSAMIAVPFAIYHFAEAVIVMECSCLCNLEKRTETLVPDIEPFKYSPNLISSYCFACDPKHCDGMAPQNPHYTCRQYGAMNQQKEKNANHPVFQIYKTRTSTIRKHHQRGKITDEERQEAIYAEMHRRLGNGGTHDE